MRRGWPSAGWSAETEINQLIAILQQKLRAVGIESQIRGRTKHFYSIWKKMPEDEREFDEIST